MSRALHSAIVLLSATAWAAPQRYEDPVPSSARTPACRAVESLALQVAKDARKGDAQAVPLRSDSRLEGAMNALVPLLQVEHSPPSQLVEEALRLYGIVEPPPQLLAVTFGSGGIPAVLSELRSTLPRIISAGRYRLIGCAEVRNEKEAKLLLALAESFVELAPIPRSLPAGGRALLEGRILPPFFRPEGFLTRPDGKVDKLDLGADPSRLATELHCAAGDGRYRVEVTGAGPFGPTVVANFPLYCGVPAPEHLSPPESADERPPTTEAEAEATLLRLLSADRKQAGVGPLALDPQLSQVARAHSLDMATHDFVGHVSPTTGNAGDRLRRAHLAAGLLLENVARASSPSEAERGLMESPGHRANLLHPEVTRVGLGVVFTKRGGGDLELFVTQLLMRPVEGVTPKAFDQLRRRLSELRRSHGLLPIEEDEILRRAAAETAQKLAKGELTPEHAAPPLERQLRQHADRYGAVQTLLVKTADIGSFVRSLDTVLLDEKMTGFGVGLSGTPDGIWVVIVLAGKR